VELVWVKELPRGLVMALLLVMEKGPMMESPRGLVMAHCILRHLFFQWLTVPLGWAQKMDMGCMMRPQSCLNNNPQHRRCTEGW